MASWLSRGVASTSPSASLTSRVPEVDFFPTLNPVKSSFPVARDGRAVVTLSRQAVMEIAARTHVAMVMAGTMKVGELKTAMGDSGGPVSEISWLVE